MWRKSAVSLSIIATRFRRGLMRALRRRGRWATLERHGSMMQLMRYTTRP